MSRSKLWKAKAKSLYQRVKTLELALLQFDALANAGDLLAFAARHVCIPRNPKFLDQETSVLEATNYWEFRRARIYGPRIDENKFWLGGGIKDGSDIRDGKD